MDFIVASAIRDFFVLLIKMARMPSSFAGMISVCSWSPITTQLEGLIFNI